MCPRFLPNNMSEVGRYYLHEGLTNPDVTLELTANNLVAPISGYSYECVIQRAGSSPVTLTLTVDNSSQSVACQINNPIDLLRQGESQVEVSAQFSGTDIFNPEHCRSRCSTVHLTEGWKEFHIEQTENTEND